MEDFLLDILGWEREEAQWLYTLCNHFGFTVDSFPLLLWTKDYCLTDAIDGDRLDPEIMEGAILQGLISQKIKVDDFRLSVDITNSKDLIVKTNGGEVLDIVYDDYDAPLYQELTALRNFIHELKELHDEFWNPNSVTKTQSETSTSNPVEKFVCKVIYGRKTSRR